MIRKFTDWARNVLGPKPGDWDTGTPDDDFLAPRGETVPIRSNHNWEDGWWRHARKTPCHLGRVGGTIKPRALVVHTTDTAPGLFNNIIKYWQREKGQGNAATFMVGRTPEDGVVQFCSIYRNSNHAGGDRCGGFLLNKHGAVVHPNLVSVGVELDAAGLLVRDAKGVYRTRDTSRKVIPPADVYHHSDGTAWHRVTDYQMATLKQLWADLYPVLASSPHSAAYGGTRRPAPWAEYRYANLVGHASINPTHKTDPGPQVMAWMRS